MSPCNDFRANLPQCDGGKGRVGNIACVYKIHKRMYSLLSNKRGGWNKRGGVTKF